MGQKRELQEVRGYGEIGLGTWEYRGGVEPLRRGIELAACFVDTAESYGTEEIAGKAIRGVRDRVFLATKALPRHFRRADLLRAADQSLARLKTDHIDLYQLHWPHYTVPLDETMNVHVLSLFEGFHSVARPGRYSTVFGSRMISGS